MYLFDKANFEITEDSIDLDKGMYTAKMATLDVVNSNRRMLMKGVMDQSPSLLVVSDWNHSAGHGDAAPVAKASLVEVESDLIASFEYQMDDPISKRSFDRVMYLKDRVEFSLGYKVKEYTIDYDAECLKIYKAQFKEGSPVTMGASPDTKVQEGELEVSFDSWLATKLKTKTKKQDQKFDMTTAETVSLINELKRRNFNFKLLAR